MKITEEITNDASFIVEDVFQKNDWSPERALNAMIHIMIMGIVQEQSSKQIEETFFEAETLCQMILDHVSDNAKLLMEEKNYSQKVDLN